MPFLQDSTAEVRADARTAMVALNAGDLNGLETALAEGRGDLDFAYFFTRETTPRMLGDALATVAGKEKDSPLKKDVDPQAYELTLVDLAGTLGLASWGRGDRELPAAWGEEFVTAMTVPHKLFGSAPDDASPVEERRADQDVANKQNLLLLLSRG